MAYAAEGKRGAVYQVRSRNRALYALKVFKPTYRNPALAAQSQLGSTLQSLPGLRASHRRVVIPSEPAARDYAELQYAILMPWIAGHTWADLLLLAEQSGMWLDTHEAVRICMDFTKVLAALEQHGIAHTDIAPANVMIDQPIAQWNCWTWKIFIFQVRRRRRLSMAEWMATGRAASRMGKRFGRQGPTATQARSLRREILVLSHTDLAKQATAEGFFLSTVGSQPGDQKYELAASYFKFFFPAFAAAFDKTWRANSLADCPSLNDLSSALAADAQLLQVITLPIKVTLNGGFTLEPVDSPKHVPVPPAKPATGQKESSGYGFLVAAVLIVFAIVLLLVIANGK